jgi:hypothetical protein
MSIRKERLFIEAKSAGEGVFETIKSDQVFTVIGKTSQGVFLLTECQNTLFLTTDHNRGPLTVNLPAEKTCFDAIFKGKKGFFSDNRILFDELAILINAQNIWRAEKTRVSIRNVMERDSFLRELCLKVADDHDGSGLSVFLPILYGINLSKYNEGTEQIEAQLFPAFLETKDKIGSNQISDLGQIFNRCLGVGRGLTPAGDDFIEGVLLALNRWGDLLPIREGLVNLNQLIITLAQQKTTSLSANLIKWATRGQADERVIDVLDAVFTGGMTVDISAKKILSVGHSSGTDILAGLATVLTAFNQQ